MVLLPGSPRPVASEDDGIYRSIFQQPQLEVPPTAPSYAWFEFLLHPDALQRHLETLRQQQSQGEHGATSAMELIREFLDQAQLVADEGNGRNHRFRALLAVAARVALQMEISLDDIERSLPTHFQRLLLDGIVDLADAECNSDSNSDTNTSNNSGLLPPQWAHLLHQRWTLRTLVRESNNGYLTSTTKHDAEEQMSGFQLALHELAPRHLQIAQSVQHTLAESSASLPMALQFDAFYDLACYFFSFTAYEKAYECFSRAAELIETPSDAIKVDQSVRSRLEGYLAACEAVMEARSRAEPSPADGQQSTPSLTLRQQIDDALTRHDWESVVELLQTELLTTDELARCPPGHRESVELHALRLVRSRNVGRSSRRVSERPDAPGAEGNASLRALRVFYKRVAISNAIERIVRPINNDLDHAEQEATNTIVRLLQEDALVPEAADVVEELVRFTLHLAIAVADDQDLVRSSPDIRAAMRRLVTRLTYVFPFVPSLQGVGGLLQQLQVTPSSTDSASSTSTWTAWQEQQEFLHAQSARQRAHFRAASDLQGVFEFPSPRDQETALALLRQSGDAMPLPPADDRVTARNLVLWLALNGAWDVLTQWRQRVDADASLAPLLDVTLAAGALWQYVSSTLSVTLDRANNNSTTAGDSSDSSATEAFTITRCNQLVHDVLTARRALLGETSSEDDEAQELLLDIPLWALDTLVCVVAGLLHRATMRNTSDHRINFDLTPYGDVALLVAFAPEPSKAKTDVSTTALLKTWLLDLVVLHARVVRCLVRRCPRDPRWHSARADLTLHPVVRLKQPSQSDPRAALRSYLVAASLATNHFADGTSVIDIIDQGSLVRLSQCLVKVGAHVPAAVLYQCFAPDEVKYGLRILQLSPESHDPAFFQYFWEMPFLELLVHLHSHPKHPNERHVTLLTHLIQSPELNNSNPVAVQKEVEQRILRCYFRDLCRIHLG